MMNYIPTLGLYMFEYKLLCKEQGLSGCRIMAITRASQARDVSSILITRSIKRIRLNFYGVAIAKNTILRF